jgi:hypothetical protein
MGNPRAAWEVEIREHDVERWHIPAWKGEVYAPTEVEARARAVRRAHIRVGVPPLRSLLRQSAPYCSAQPSVKTELFPD